MIKEIVIQTRTDNDYLLEHEIYMHESGSKTLVVLFPGGNYTCERPLLHYMRKSAIENGFDVLCMDYGTAFKHLEFGDTLFDTMAYELKKTVINRLNEGSYTRMVLASKSLGTVVAGMLSLEIEGYKIENIFLTPIERTIEYMNEHKNLVVTGTMDSLFPKENYDRVNRKNNQLMIIEDANHALEIRNDLAGTINVHRDVLLACDEFMK